MDRKFVRVEAGTPAERFTGTAPVVVERREWYGQPVYVCERASDGRLFTVYPCGCSLNLLDAIEEAACETLEQKGW